MKDWKRGLTGALSETEDGDKLTLFAAQQSVLTHSPLPHRWASQYRDVEIATARGFVHIHPGPVLALWPSAQGLQTSWTTDLQ